MGSITGLFFDLEIACITTAAYFHSLFRPCLSTKQVTPIYSRSFGFVSLMLRAGESRLPGEGTPPFYVARDIKQNGQEYQQSKSFSECNQQKEGNLPESTILAHSCGVNPSVETNCNWRTCRSLNFCVQTASSPPEWSSVGEAEAGSGGDQPAEE
jgi:hypothetical protein